MTLTHTHAHTHTHTHTQINILSDECLQEILAGYSTLAREIENKNFDTVILPEDYDGVCVCVFCWGVGLRRSGIRRMFCCMYDCVREASVLMPA